MSQEPFFQQMAEAHWSQAKRAASVEAVLNAIRFNQKALVPFDEVRKHLKLRHRFYRGVQQIALDKIAGSVGRYQDFTRTFLPRTNDIRQRWQRVSAVMSSSGTPPVELYKVGDAYFVADGNHRASVARVHGAKTIEAEVWEYITPAHLREDVTLDKVLLEAEHLDFLKYTRLDELRPEHGIRFTIPGRYVELEYQIALFQQVMEEIDGEPCSLEKAVVNWYDLVYQPTIDIIQRENIMHHFPGRTEADLFAWISRHQRRLSAKYGLPVSVKDTTRRFRGRGPLARLRRLLARREM